MACCSGIGMLAPRGGRRVGAARLGDRRKAQSRPHAGTSRARRFRRARPAPTRFMPSFQSPVPNSGRPCEPIAKTRVRARERNARTAAPDPADAGAAELLQIARRERPAAQERYLLVEHRKIPRDLEIMRDHEGQPDAVIRYPRLDSLPGGRQPPMLHVAFLELPRGRAQDVLARNAGCRHAQRHDILQLIAKPVSAARLIKGRAPPDAAAQGLVQEPAVETRISMDRSGVLT